MTGRFCLGGHALASLARHGVAAPFLWWQYWVMMVELRNPYHVTRHVLLAHAT